MPNKREYLRDDSQVNIRALGECVTTRAIRGSPYTRDRDTCDIIPTGNATDVFDRGAISRGIETGNISMRSVNDAAEIPPPLRDSLLNYLPPCAAVNTFLSSGNAMPVSRVPEEIDSERRTAKFGIFNFCNGKK